MSAGNHLSHPSSTGSPPQGLLSATDTPGRGQLMLRTLRSLSPALAVALLAAPAAAHAAPVAKQASAAKSKKASTKTVYPTVSSINPRKITVGEKLTILGKNFRAGKGKSSVAFYKSGKPVVFIKADTATTTKLIVTIPNKLADILAQKDGA